MQEEKDNMNAAREAAQGADARREEGAAAGADLGKFRSVDALLNAYNALEAEFTRRSQRLRELEAGARNNAGASAGDNVLPPAAHMSSASADAGGEVSGEQKRAIVAEYLAAVAEGAPVVMAGGGTHVSAPGRRARSIEEAGAFAADLFRKKG